MRLLDQDQVQSVGRCDGVRPDTGLKGEDLLGECRAEPRDDAGPGIGLKPQPEEERIRQCDRVGQGQRARLREGCPRGVLDRRTPEFFVQKELRERQLGGLQEALAMAVEIALQIRVSQRGSPWVLRQEDAHLFDQQAADDDVLVESKGSRLADQLLGRASGAIAERAHLLDESAMHAAVLEVQCQQAGLAIEHLLFDGLRDQGGHLRRGGEDSPAPDEVLLHHADLLRRDEDRLALHGWPWRLGR